MKERLFKIVGAFVLVGSLIAGWMLMSYQHFQDQPMAVADSGMDFKVEAGSSVRRVAQNMQRLGLVENGHFFVWMARLRGQAGKIQAGEYRVEPGMTPEVLLDNMVSGKVQQYSLTIIEGWNFYQMMEAVDNSPYLQHKLLKLTPEQIMARIGYEEEHHEGRFFPDTYRFSRDTTDIELLKLAYRSMSERLEQAWQGREENLPYETPYEALIMASIVEKETGKVEERETIAGVFVRRLQKGMRLQTDPTVIYGIGQEYDGNIRAEDLRKDTPYNTYTRSGLPPTPIAMPGAEAINAALHPEKGDALYFVSRGDGSHHFSASYEEHECAVVKYQIRRRDCDHPNFKKD